MPDDARQPSEAQTGAGTDAATAAAPESKPAPKPAPEAAPDAAPVAAAVEAGSSADAKASQEEPGGAKVRNLFGTLDSEERIRAGEKQNERALWASAIGVSLLYAGLIASQAMQLTAADLAEMMKRKRGQDAPDSISVELVPDPDPKAKTKRWQEGAQAQQQDPEQRTPQPPQVASLPQPETEEIPVEEPKTFSPPTLPDLETLVDAAAADLDRKIKRAFEKKPQKPREERQAVAPGGAMQLRGTGASGKSDAFSRSVIAALMKTRPGPLALWGRVLVSFEITETGQLKYVRLLQSSGNSALDDAAINAIRRARFAPPPPGLSVDQRTYIIDYVFG